MVRRTPWWAIVAAAALLAACGAVDNNTDSGSSSGAALDFTPATGVEPLVLATSQNVTVGGLGRSEIATVDANTTLVRNGTVVGASAAVQDGDVLSLQTPASQSGLTKTASIVVGTTTSTWTVTARTVDVGAFVAGSTTAADIQTSDVQLAVPFTPVQAFKPRYAGIMLFVPGLENLQPKPQRSTIRADALGQPGSVVIVATSTEQLDPSYLRLGSAGSTYPVLGGGTYQVPDQFAPQADFGPNAPQLTAGTRYWLVNEYATPPSASGTVAFRAGAAPVASGPAAKQSPDGAAWTDWGVPASSPGTRLLPGMFVSD
jgi:hypothetical protein